MAPLKMPNSEKCGQIISGCESPTILATITGYVLQWRKVQKLVLYATAQQFGHENLIKIELFLIVSEKSVVKGFLFLLNTLKLLKLKQR